MVEFCGAREFAVGHPILIHLCEMECIPISFVSCCSEQAVSGHSEEPPLFVYCLHHAYAAYILFIRNLHVEHGMTLLIRYGRELLQQNRTEPDPILIKEVAHCQPR